MEKFRQLKRWLSEHLNHNSIIYKIIYKSYHKVSSIKYDITNTKSSKNWKQKIHYKKQVYNAINIINNNYVNAEYIALYNPTWLGVANSTKGLFSNAVPLEQVLGRRKIAKISKAILKANIKTIIFSQIVDGWTDILRYIKKKNPNLKIKVIWHANNFEVISDYTWDLNKKVLKLYDDKFIDEFAFVKKNMVEFYNKAGYKAVYLTNNVHINETINKTEETSDSNYLKIGIYNANSRELKNIYNQLAAIRLLKGAKVDIVPANADIIKFANIMKLEFTHLMDYIDTKDLLRRLKSNDINIYITFTECSPMVPLESFEIGVPCLIGNNNDYFQNSELRKYVVVDREDDPVYIKEKIINCIENKDKILEMYKDWKKQYDKDCEEYVKAFIKD